MSYIVNTGSGYLTETGDEGHFNRADALEFDSPREALHHDDWCAWYTVEQTHYYVLQDLEKVDEGFIYWASGDDWSDAKITAYKFQDLQTAVEVGRVLRSYGGFNTKIVRVVKR